MMGSFFWFVLVLVVLGFLLVSLVFTIDLLFPTPDPAVYASERVPVEVRENLVSGDSSVS